MSQPPRRNRRSPNIALIVAGGVILIVVIAALLAQAIRPSGAAIAKALVSRRSQVTSQPGGGKDVGVLEAESSVTLLGVSDAAGETGYYCVRRDDGSVTGFVVSAAFEEILYAQAAATLPETQACPPD